jgi:hypothetical protein
MPISPRILFLARIEDGDFQPIPWAGRLSIMDAPDFAPPYAAFRGSWREASLNSGSPSDPQFFMPPQSGVAANGLPIYNWDQAAAQLTRHSDGWGNGYGNPATVTYAYRESAPSMPAGVSIFSPFSAAQIAATEEILELWSEVANITFTRVNDADGYTNNATMLFGNYGATDGEESAVAF